MNEKRIQEIMNSFGSRTTEELQAIWKKNDRREYSEEGLEAVKRVLADRKVELPVQDQTTPPPTGMRQKEPPECPACGSLEIKKHFFGGSKGWAIACFALGFLVTCQELSRPHGDPTVLLFALVCALAGVAALTGKRFKCRNCKKAFNQRKK